MTSFHTFKHNNTKRVFTSHFDRVDGAGCFAKFVFLVSRDCFVALPCDAMSLSEV